MAKVIFERSGGFLEPPIDLTLDLDTLSPSEAQRLLYLIEDADFFRLPQGLVAVSAGDEFLYTIAVETSATRHCVCVSETNLPEALQLLINDLSALTPVP